MVSSGLVYCATGEKYASLAIESISSFRREGGGLPVQLFCDRESEILIRRNLPLNDIEIRVLDRPTFGFADKIVALMSCDFDKGIFVDCDTYFLHYSLENSAKQFQTEVLQALDSLDLLALPGLGLNRENERDWASLAVGQFNTGVIGFRRSEALVLMLKNWLALYELEDSHDQPAFRKAAILSKIRAGSMMPEYNFQGNGLLNFRPRLIHLTGGPRKMWSLDSALMAEFSKYFDERVYPRLFIEFQEVHPLPSRKLKTLGAPLSYYLAGVKSWISTRLEIFFMSKKYRNSL